MTSTHNTEQLAVAERREAMSRRLLPVMERMLGDESFIEISIERLVREADISRSGFYMYFSDKGDLLRALTRDVMADLFGVAGAWWELPPHASKTQLRAALDGVAAAYLPHANLMSAIVEASSYHPEVADQFALLMRQAHKNVLDYIESAQASGDVRKDMDAERVAEWITWMLERGLYQLVAVATEPERDDLMQALTDIIWRTLYQAGD